MKIDKVLIVGGTHGNELTSVFLLNHWMKNRDEISKYEYMTELLLSNKKAIGQKKRYVDKDLNRCFLKDNLNNMSLNSHEDMLAKEINKAYGPESHSGFNFIIDMHTSTSVMGITLMVESNRFNLKIADYVRKHVPDVNIYCFEKSIRTESCLRSITPYAIGVEIGPVAQNRLCHKTINKMKLTVDSILDAIVFVCTERDENTPYEVTDVYCHVDDVAFPDESVGRGFLIHEKLERKNYQPLRKGDPLFLEINGETIRYEGEDNLCPVFVNEAAYYDKNIAFSLVEKKTLIK